MTEVEHGVGAVFTTLWGFEVPPCHVCGAWPPDCLRGIFTARHLNAEFNAVLAHVGQLSPWGKWPHDG